MEVEYVRARKGPLAVDTDDSHPFSAKPTAVEIIYPL